MYPRKIESFLKQTFKAGDSVLLLGPRQVGKTTLFRTLYPEALKYNLADPKEKLRLAHNPGQFIPEIKESLPRGGFFIVDEIQKVAALFDALQVLLDDPQVAYQALLTGSSARKIKTGAVNTLPGRVLQVGMGPLDACELGFYSEKNPKHRNELLLSMMTRGQLPKMVSLSEDRVPYHLRSYVQTYLEEEILGDALTKDIGSFSRFLTVMAARSGKILNYSSLSQESGVTVNTIKHHVSVLVDTMTAHLIPGFSLNDTKTWLSTPRLLFFDLGVRNAAAQRVISAPALIAEYGFLFEQWVGLELLAFMRNREPPLQLFYWRTTQNREVDWVLKFGEKFLAIEIKWEENWNSRDLIQLEAFASHMKEHHLKVKTLLVCRTEKPARVGTHRIIPPHFLLEELENFART